MQVSLDLLFGEPHHKTVVKRTAIENRLRFFFTMFSTSAGERIFIYFEKIRFASQKTEFLNFCVLKKRYNINDLKWLRNNNKKNAKTNLFYFGFFVFINL